MSDRNGITLVANRETGVWDAIFDGPHAALVKHSFGTDTVPTAFFADTPAALVIAKIQERNPGVTVTACSGLSTDEVRAARRNQIAREREVYRTSRKGFRS